MALHIADPEVTRLTAELAELEGTSKTEALRRLLRSAVEKQRRESKRQKLEAMVRQNIERARRERIEPYTKEESNTIFEGMEP